VDVNVFFGAESLSVGKGGIAQLARLTAKVLDEEVAAGRLDVRCLALNDRKPPDEFALQARVASGSRARFVYEVNKAAFSHSHFLYDALGMARAHCRMPLLRRPFMAWICGIEVWEETMPCRIKWAGRAHTLLSISDYTRWRAHQLHGGFDRAKVCWPGTEDNEPAVMRQAGNGPPTVLILGRLVNERPKGHAELIDCWPKVLSAVPDARLVIAGFGSGMETLRRKAALSPAAGRIEFRGFVPQERIDALWAEASVFAMPSRGEGFGLVYIEAMRRGLPVVASIHDAAQEINPDGETGYNVNLDDPDQLPERLIELLDDPDRAIAMGRKGQARWANHFRYTAFKSRFLPRLNQFLEEA